MKEFKFIIDDESWEVAILPKDEYDSMLGCDSEAQVDVNQRQMAFCLERITKEILEHEITHIYFNKCCLSSVDTFTVDQVEEIVAEFVPKYSKKITVVAKLLKKTIDKAMLEE